MDPLMFFRLPILNQKAQSQHRNGGVGVEQCLTKAKCTGGAAVSTAIEVVMMELVALALLGAMILGEALILWNFIRLFE